MASPTIRTPVIAVKGRCPRPLDDGDPESALDPAALGIAASLATVEVAFLVGETGLFFRVAGGGKRDRTADLFACSCKRSSQGAMPPAQKEAAL